MHANTILQATGDQGGINNLPLLQATGDQGARNGINNLQATGDQGAWNGINSTQQSTMHCCSKLSHHLYNNNNYTQFSFFLLDHFSSRTQETNASLSNCLCPMVTVTGLSDHPNERLPTFEDHLKVYNTI